MSQRLRHAQSELDAYIESFIDAEALACWNGEPSNLEWWKPTPTTRRWGLYTKRIEGQPLPIEIHTHRTETTAPCPR